MPGRIETVKSGAVIFLISSSSITSLAICRRLAGTILQAVETILHLGDPPLEPCCQGFIRECCADDCRDNLMQVGEPLDRIGEGLFVDVGVFRPDPISDRAVGRWRQIRGSWFKLQIVNFGSAKGPSDTPCGFGQPLSVRVNGCTR